MTTPTTQPAWTTLEALAQQLGDASLQALFAADDTRVQQLSAEASGLYLDYAKQRLTPEVMTALRELAAQQGLEARREALFNGRVVNDSEQRAAWHTALRAPRCTIADGASCDEVHAVLDGMREFAQAVRAGDWQGYDGRAIRDVVNIGIGGSGLGPRLVCDALAEPDNGPRVHFVANVDPDELADTLTALDPATTLFVVTSKSFGTAETLANARAARQWLYAAGASHADVARHFIAVSTHREAVDAFGIERMFEFWDWVGGRFSLWSAAGLSIALALGMDGFEQLLAGAHAMDRHFATAAPEHNLPLNLALVGIWNRNFLGLDGHVVVPYAQRLERFAEWLQQTEMESNGKSVSRHGEALATATVPMVWGTVGTNAQHAYFQGLHQGDVMADVDFILPLTTASGIDDERERQRVANCLGQAQALMTGRARQTAQAGDSQAEILAAARNFDGNRPSSMLLLERLDAWHLGALLAVYEHKVFVQGVIWDINSFDQWGVELGKELASELGRELEGPATSNHDASTQALLARVRGQEPV